MALQITSQAVECMEEFEGKRLPVVDIHLCHIANGNRLTKTVNDVTTYYTYDDAEELLSDGSTDYTYDENGNLVAADDDTFTWDYADRLTGATVGEIDTSYAYDGDGTRVGKTVDEVPTAYLWDRECCLPQMVDDGTNAYLHSGSFAAQIDDAGDPTYLLDDGLGSVRGLTDSSGDLTGSADYDVFGEVRASSGASSVFGFTGEQFDSETGFTFLRARYLDPRLGRFFSMDSVQPNAPGTQGYNPYSYAGNNPMTWVDPSGHTLALVAVPYIALAVVVMAYLYVNLLPALVPEENREEFDRYVQDKVARIFGSGSSRGSKGNASDKGGETGQPCGPGDSLCIPPGARVSFDDSHVFRPEHDLDRIAPDTQTQRALLEQAIRQGGNIVELSVESVQPRIIAYRMQTEINGVWVEIRFSVMGETQQILVKSAFAMKNPPIVP